MTVERAKGLSGGAASGNGDMYDRDPRIGALEQLVDKRADNTTEIGRYFRTRELCDSSWAGGSSGLIRLDLTVRNYEAQAAFAGLVSKQIGREGSLTSEGFDDLIERFMFDPTLFEDRDESVYAHLHSEAQKNILRHSF